MSAADADPPSPAPGEGGPEGYERLDVSTFEPASGDLAADHAAAEGAETPDASDAGEGGGKLGWLKQAAFKTEPSPDLADVEDPWNPDEGGVTRIKRAFLKATGADGLPAVADLLIGIFETVWSYQIEGGRGGGGGSDDDGGDDGRKDPTAEQGGETFVAVQEG
jgi:hypothetical protein